MAVELFGAIDVTDKVFQRGRSNAALNDVAGILAQQRTYLLADNEGENSPFTPFGSLFRNDWRNGTIEETDRDGAEIFTGSINSVETRIDQNGYQTFIQAREPLGVILKFKVEENDISTHSGFLVNGTASKGSTSITIDTGTTDIPTGSQVTFEDDLVPRYQIISTSGSPTTSITIDRPLEFEVSDNDAVRISVPTEKTAALAIFDALVSAGLSSRLGSTFASINTANLASSRLIRMHVRIEDRITLASHIAKLLEFGNLYLTVSTSGIIDIQEGLQWTGTKASNTVTSNEIIPPVRTFYDNSRLIRGYDCLYFDDTTDRVRVASGDVDQTVIDQWAGQDRWQPIDAKSSLAIDYNYLYNSAATADSYGRDRLDYFGVPRIRVNCKLKNFRNKNPLDTISPQLVKEFALTYPVSTVTNFVDEPARVVEFNFDDRSKSYTSVTFELTNNPSPNIPRNIPESAVPVVLESYEIDQGITSVFEPISSGLSLWIQVFLADQVFKIVDQEVTANTQGDGNSYNIFQNSLLTNGQTYYVKYYTMTGSTSSATTEFIELVPNSQGTAQWDSGTGAQNIQEWGA